MPAKKRTRWQRWWPFGLLCLVAAFRWVISESLPAAAPTALSLALGCFSASLLILTIALARGLPVPTPRVCAESAIAGALMVCGPFAALLFHAHTVEATGLTMALMLVPVVVAVARPAFRHTEGGELAGRLWPGIVGVTGMLLMLPQPSLANAVNDAVMAVSLLATGIGAAWFRTRNGTPIWRMLAALGGAALVFTVGIHTIPASAVKGMALAAALDGGLMLLSVGALLRIGATRWSAQFVIVPLIIFLESLVLAHLWHLDARVLVGLGLMIFATVFLLLPPRADDPGELLPREAVPK